MYATKRVVSYRFIKDGAIMMREATFTEAFEAVKKYRQDDIKPVFWETAWKKAAASSTITWPQEIISLKGTYKIEIMQSEEDENKGIIIVSILRDKEQLEGKFISISDENGMILLHDKIQNASAYNSNLNLKNINLKLLVNTLD